MIHRDFHDDTIVVGDKVVKVDDTFGKEFIITSLPEWGVAILDDGSRILTEDLIWVDGE